MLEKIKLLLDLNDQSKDTLINLLIDMCTSQAEGYCNAEYAEDWDGVIIKMVIESYNRLGNEGVNSVSYSGITESLALDYSAPIIRELQSKRKMVLL